jgi:hypothetical protein
VGDLAQPRQPGLRAARRRVDDDAGAVQGSVSLEAKRQL